MISLILNSAECRKIRQTRRSMFTAQLLCIGVVIFFALGACSMPQVDNSVAEKLEIDGRTRRRYHLLAESPFGFELIRPGFIVAIEKSPKPLINNGGLSAYADYIKYPDGEGSAYNEQKRRYTEIMSGETDMFVSHIAAYSLESRRSSESERFLYNIYPDFGSKVFGVSPSVPNSYARRGWDAVKTELLQAVRSEIKIASDNVPYTHLIIASMGWDNDQIESMRNYNAIIGNLLAAAQRAGGSGPRFKPLLIGITWPSVWGWPSWFDLGALFYKLFSYGVKADDADEIGLTIANWLVNELGSNVKQYANDLKTPVRIVALGHSFGGRLISRAVFSDALLNRTVPQKPASPVDLLVGLQAAFSVNRFLTAQGEEGAPYSLFSEYTSKGTRIVMTWSENDSANPLSNYISGAAHIGGYRGYQLAKTKTDSGEINGVFQFVALGQDAALKPESISNANRILYVDASKVVKDHNDVFDHEIGRFLWSAIDRFAPVLQ